ncbi:hypothetical protein B5X24_HaOG213198 [Helicoverpa armigera]|uniref:Uncharacterized protein n=1 Tax=Helicoverpa armigera TaxID=29058 RepID=A0A2W1B5K8_HELAM|nr:hypothetical protein B5X24_HaOG213198 [Helicoverpa armigera]
MGCFTISPVDFWELSGYGKKFPGTLEKQRETLNNTNITLQQGFVSLFEEQDDNTPTPRLWSSPFKPDGVKSFWSSPSTGGLT